MAKLDLIQRFVARGRRKGFQRGRVEAMRAAVLSNLDARFGSVPQRIRARIGEIADEALLDQLHRAAATARGLAAFEREL